MGDPERVPQTPSGFPEPSHSIPESSRGLILGDVTYKLLALDVDGTLLRRDGTVHPEDHAAIGRVRAAGVAVTIVTGRMYSGTEAVARSVGIEGPIACVDGSHIVDLAGDRALFHA